MVASGPSKPYFLRKYGLTEKGVFMRVGSATEQMPAKQIEELFSRRVRNSLSQITSPKRDLKFEQLHIYYQGKGKTLNEQFARNLELLNDDGDYNYVAYLMNDENSTSVKVARYNGLNKVNLIESNEYGYECLIKATNQVLEKLNLENRTRTKITASQREEKRLWNPVALREAIINAFVHNDYSREVAPTFEIYDDRLEITSYGGLPQGLSEQEIFQGYSIPRNQELMRIYKDLDYVEQLGSGVPRILEHYGEEAFRFSRNFLRMILPSSEQVTPQVTPQVLKLLKAIKGNRSRSELQEILNLKDREYFRKDYLKPAIEAGFVGLTIPDKPRSSKQKYYLTEKGKAILEAYKK